MGLGIADCRFPIGDLVQSDFGLVQGMAVIDNRQLPIGNEKWLNTTRVLS
jgi:hypothetical protein